MSKNTNWDPEYFRMRDNARLMQAHDAVVDMISGRTGRCTILDALSFGCRLGSITSIGLDFGHTYPGEFVEYVSSDEESDYDQQSNYCGLAPNFLNRGDPPKPALTTNTYTIKSKPKLSVPRRISQEEAERNAKELIEEEEKLKKKAEKKKLKKMRQKERRRLEREEKENANKIKDKQVDPDPGRTKLSDKDRENINRKDKKAAAFQPLFYTSEDESVSEEEEDEEEDNSLACEPEELDMNSCFVSNAAAIAKRKLEQKPKPDRKERRAESSEKQPRAEQRAANPQTQNDAESERLADVILRSMELAVIGNQYAAAGHLEMAVKYFTDAIKYNPKEYKLFGNRSFCYEKLQQYEKALTDADIALSMSPTWIKGLYRRGKALVGLKRYCEALLVYKDVLKLDSACTDAAQELMRVQIMQLMEMGFSREQSSNALIIHGTVEKALDALSGIQSSYMGPPMVSSVPLEEEWVRLGRRPQSPKAAAKAPPQNQLKPSTPGANATQPELFPVWVGGLVPGITNAKIHDLFNISGPVHSVKVLQGSRCAFVNYTRRDYCEKAIQQMHGLVVEGTALIVRYPDRIHTHLGVSKTATTDPLAAAKTNSKRLPDECYFWRTTGCIKSKSCTYRHVPEHKGIDRPKAK